MMWRDILKASLFPAVLAALLIWAMMRMSTDGRQDGSVASVGEYFVSLARLLRDQAMLFLVMATALRAVGESAIGEFLPVYLREDLDFSPTRVAIYLSLAKVAGLASQPIMGFLSDRFSRKAVLVPGLAVSAVLSLLLAVADPGVQLFLIVAVTGAFSFSLHHIFIAAALDAAKGQVQSTVVSLIYGAGLLATFSPYVAGTIADYFGDVRSSFVYGGAIILIPVVMLSWLRFPEKGAEPVDELCTKSRLGGLWFDRLTTNVAIRPSGPDSHFRRGARLCARPRSGSPPTSLAGSGAEGLGGTPNTPTKEGCALSGLSRPGKGPA